MAFQNHAKTRQELADQLDGDKCESVTHFLMPASYDPECKVYTLADGSVGVVIRIDPKPCSVSNDQELEEISEAMASALSRLPPNAIGQFILIPTPAIGAQIENYLSMGTSTHPVIDSIQKRKAQFFNDSIKKPIFEFGELKFRTKTYSIICTITVQTNEMVGSAGGSLLDFVTDYFSRFFKKEKVDKNAGLYDTARAFKATAAERRYVQAYESLVKDILEASRKITGVLDSRKIAFAYLQPQELINVVQAMIYPLSSSNGERVTYDESVDIARQIALKDIAVFGKTGSIVTDGAKVYHKTISLSENIKSTQTGCLTRPNPDLGWLSLLDYIGDGYIAINFHLMAKKDMRTHLNATRKKAKEFSMPGKRERIFQDLDLADRYLETDNRGFFNLQMVVSTWDTDERRAEERANNLRQKIDDTGILTRKEEHFAAAVFFAGLPFGWAPAIKEAKRMFLVADRVITDLAPLYGLSRGTRNACFLAHNRYGEPFILDLFDSNGAPHFLIVGESGSGKSFLTTSLILDFCRDENAKVFVVDRGKSYSTPVNLLQGQFNQLTLDNKTCTNVFAGTLATSGAFSINFLSFLAARTASEAVSSNQNAVLEQAKDAAYREMQTTIDYTDHDKILVSPKAIGKKVWIHQAYKRMRVRYIDHVKMANITNLKSADTGDTREFQLYYIAVLRSRTFKTPETGEQTETYQDSASLSPQSRELLKGRSFLIEDRPVGGGLVEPIALYLSEDKEQLLENAGFSFIKDSEEMVLCVAKPSDIKELAEAGIEPIYDNDFTQACIKQAEDQINADPAIKTVDKSILDTKIRHIVEDLRTPQRYFDTLTGQCVLQFEVTMTSFITSLKEIDNEDARTMVARLRPYYGNGTHAGFFDGTTGFDLVRPKIICWEIGELDAAGEHIVASVMTALLQSIYLYCQDPRYRPFRKMLVIDEFWALLKIDLVAEQIINMYKTGRKFGMSIGVISQSVKDFLMTPNGKRVLDGATCKFLMKQSEEVIRSLQTTLGFSAEKAMMAGTAHTKFGSYSEAFIDFPSAGIQEIMRLCPVPYVYWIASTDKTDVKVRERLITEYRAGQMALVEATDKALQTLAEKYPRGAKTAGVRL